MVNRNHGDNPWATWGAALFFVAIAGLPLLIDTKPSTQSQPNSSFNGVWILDDKSFADIEPASLPRYVFENSTMTMQSGGEVVGRYSITTDTSHDPPHIDMVLDSQSIGGPTSTVMMAFLPEMRTKGIYQLSGNRLVICENMFSGDRPTSFKADPQNGDVLLILKRGE